MNTPYFEVTSGVIAVLSIIGVFVLALLGKQPSSVLNSIAVGSSGFYFLARNYNAGVSKGGNGK